MHLARDFAKRNRKRKATIVVSVCPKIIVVSYFLSEASKNQIHVPCHEILINNQRTILKIVPTKYARMAGVKMLMKALKMSFQNKRVRQNELLSNISLRKSNNSLKVSNSVYLVTEALTFSVGMRLC